MVKIEIDSHSGFCFGVVYAIEMAQDYLQDNGSLYCLGDIVHNDLEVERLKKLGLKIITHDDLKNLHDCAVLIRAHGEPPSTYQLAIENNIELIDASCPVVLKLQNRVRQAHDDKRSIVILGKPGHAEVNGLVGQTLGKATVISSLEEARNLEVAGPVTLFSQTTKSTRLFYQVKEELAGKSEDFIGHDTICRQVSNREPDLAEFAGRHGAVVFIAGKKSSNGQALFGVCKQVNSRSYFISSIEELDTSWLQGVSSVGICGATSTPLWQMEEVAAFLQEQINGSLVNA